MSNKKTRIFLIIGLTKESAHWDDHFIEHLKQKFQTEDIIGLDLPGAGQLFDQKSPTTISGIVKMTRNHYVDFFDGKTRNILISISLGGMVATQWLKLYPTDFDHFVIVNSSFRGFSPIYRRLRPKALQKFVKVFLAQNDQEREQHVIELCSNNLKAYEYTKEKWVKIAKERSMTKANILRQLVAASRYRPEHKPHIPTLIMAARHDRLAHFSCSKKLHHHWGGDLHILEDTHIGHAVHIDAPKDLARIIYQWDNAKQ